MAAKVASSWCVYFLRCGDGSLYCGITNDVARRLAAHEQGRGARYTRGRLPLALVHLEPAADRGQALRCEARYKRMTRAQKLALIAASAAASPGARPRRRKGIRRGSSRPDPG